MRNRNRYDDYDRFDRFDGRDRYEGYGYGHGNEYGGDRRDRYEMADRMADRAMRAEQFHNTRLTEMPFRPDGMREERGIWDRVKSAFNGHGPKGYRRSDERIREDVCDLMTDHPELDASDIEVEVKDAEVTLNGTVPERFSKRLAEDLADHVRGVRDVHNRLRLRREEPAQITGTSAGSQVGAPINTSAVQGRH